MEACCGQPEIHFAALPMKSDSGNLTSGTDDDTADRRGRGKLEQPKRKRWIVLIQVAIVIGLIVGTSAMAINKSTRKRFLDACDSFRELSGGWLIYLTIATLLVVAFIPTTFFEITCAYLYGFWLGVAMNSTSKLVGSLISFSLGRHCCKVKVRSWARGYSIFSAFEKSMAESWKLLFLFRLGYFPMGLKNYGLSVVNDLTYYRFLLVALISGSPFTITFSLTGASLKDLTEALDGEDMDSKRLALLVIALVCTAALIFVLLWKVRQMNTALSQIEDCAEAEKLEMTPAGNLLEEKNKQL